MKRNGIHRVTQVVGFDSLHRHYEFLRRSLAVPPPVSSIEYSSSLESVLSAGGAEQAATTSPMIVSPQMIRTVSHICDSRVPPLIAGSRNRPINVPKTIIGTSQPSRKIGNDIIGKLPIRRHLERLMTDRRNQQAVWALPGMTAGPLSPPFRRPSRVSSCRPPFSVFLAIAAVEWNE